MHCLKLNQLFDFEKTKTLHRPGIEPGPPAWQARILPLDQRCARSRMLCILNMPKLESYYSHYTGSFYESAMIKRIVQSSKVSKIFQLLIIYFL